MVRESNCRFNSDQKTILEVLDPIHRSLLLNNSELESKNNNTDNPLTRSSSETCKLFKIRQQQQQQVQQQQLPEQQQKQQQSENKHFCDASFSKKPDATCVNEEYNNTDEFEYTRASTDKKQNYNIMLSRKNIQVRITTNKRRSVEKNLERMSSESQTDSSNYDYVESDSDVESSNSAGEQTTVTSGSSGSSTNAPEFSDYNDFNNFESSSNDEATTTASSCSGSSSSSRPMIQIVQEITEQRTVRSMVHVNKKKVKTFQKTNVDRLDRVVVSSKGKPKWKNKQKIIDDNVCNELLDETINWDVMEGKTQNETMECPIIVGELKAKPKYTQRTMGKLMERRLSRALSQNDKVTFSSIQKFESSTEVSRASIAPAKPPRTFTSSSSSKSSSDSIGANTATTLAIEDFHKSSAFHTSPQISPGGGWVFDSKTPRQSTKPTCPTFDDINDFEKTKKIGWVSSIPKREEFVHVLNMLNDTHPISSKITSSNLSPEPQFVPTKEDIDQVDSIVPPKPAIRRSKQRMSMDLNDSICSSTPVKRINNFTSFSVPNSMHSEMEICKKCKLQIIKPSSTRKSFGRGAIKRTKLFFKASKNIWTKPKPSKPSASENCSENDLDFDYDSDVETPTKLKSNTTADFNTDETPRIEKKTVKTLDLTPQSINNNVNERPGRIFDKFLTSVKRTPPKKPVRQSLSHNEITRSPTRNEEGNFNFDRVIDSPKSKEKSFKLSPRKLFCSINERSTESQPNTYRSFESDQRDDLKQCIVEYLRNMNDKIEHKPSEVESATVPRWRSRIRRFSTSSDAIDYLPQRQRVVQIDCHPEPTEPIYSEIIPQPAPTPLNHIIVNDNPKAIYATVNKTKNQKAVPSMSVDVNEIHKTNLEISESLHSLDKLSLNNNFADSVLNMLELMKQQNSDDSERNADSEMSDSDDFKLKSVGPNVRNYCVDEHPTIKLTSERLQQSVFKGSDDAFAYNTSTETFFTESICDDVIRGDSVNNNIVAMIDQLENMDLVSTVGLVEPETDDESVSIDGIHGNDDFDHTAADSSSDVEYCTIIEQNIATNPEPIDTVRQFGNSLPFATTSSDTPGRRRINRLQSPLLSAPSMLEITDHYMLKLTNQITAQREIRNQLKHAIKICRTTKEFECSSELIEAERLMLLSAKKEVCAKLELTRIDYEGNGLTTNPAKCTGTVTIKKIEFDLKSEEILEQIFQLSYICICSYRDQVIATHARERNGNKIQFDDVALKIVDLNSSFEIKLEVFVLRLPRQLRKYSHESKYHLNKISKKQSFLNPVKLFSSSSTSQNKLSTDSDESRFRLRGVATISAKSLSSEKFEIVRNSSWPKNHVYISYNTKSLNLKINDQFTNMTGALRTEFICEINLRDSGLRGLIRIAEECHTMTERWCRLNGCTLEFWNNDIDCLNMKPPILSIDLVKCTNETIELIDDKLALDIFNEEMTGQDGKNRFIRYWISAYNQNDLILWLTDLNRILKFIKDWNI